MVGVAILRDFESGSYEKMRLTFYDGITFEDIDRGGDFISCVVEHRTRRIVYDFNGNVKRPTAAQIFDISGEVIKLWMENEYATIVRFTYNYNETKLRIVSEKLGVCGIPDKYALFSNDRTDVYKLVCDVRGKDILYISALCEALNLGVESLFNVRCPMYVYASAGIYINVFLSEVCTKQKLTIPPQCSKYRHSASRYYRRLSRAKIPALSSENAEPPVRTGAFSGFVADVRDYKCRMQGYILESGEKTQDYLFRLPLDEQAGKLTSRFYMSAGDFASGLKDYFHSAMHVRFVSPKDLLMFMCDPSCHRQIIDRARAACINYRFHAELPCPEYYDSRGRAYR